MKWVTGILCVAALVVTALGVGTGETVGADEGVRSAGGTGGTPLRTVRHGEGGRGCPSGDHAPTAVLDSLDGYYGPVVFDHALHEGMSVCVNCHHDLETNEGVSACGSCHRAGDYGSTDPQPSLKGAYHRQCLGCHREWSGANACGFCHTEEGTAYGAPGVADMASTALRRLRVRATFAYQTEHPGMPVVTFHHADHADRFGLSCAECHGQQSCAECHGARAAPPTISREETCISCHEGESCVFCHNVGQKGRFDHGMETGWRLEEYHAQIACDECHGGGMVHAAPSSDQCKRCHQLVDGTEFDHAARGVPLLGSHGGHDCIECHVDGTRSRASCTNCHEARSYPEYRPGDVGDVSGLDGAALGS